MTHNLRLCGILTVNLLVFSDLVVVGSTLNVVDRLPKFCLKIASVPLIL